jgi:hypothetical protein
VGGMNASLALPPTLIRSFSLTPFVRSVLEFLLISECEMSHNVWSSLLVCVSSTSSGERQIFLRQIHGRLQVRRL